MDLDVGQVVDNYRLDRGVHRGRVTTVYAATDIALGRRVAFKVLDGDAGDEATRRRFVGEARVAASLDGHPGIVRVFDWGQVGSAPYFVTEFISGISLAELIERQPGGGGLPVTESVDILGQVAAAIDHAHLHGAIHRDIKPANIMVKMAEVPRRAYLVDFGITKTADHPDRAEADAGSPGQFLGTVGYASPEQIAGDGVDERSDVYSFAATAFDVLAGRPPYAEALGDAARLGAHLVQPVPGLSAIRRDLPPSVDEVFERGMAKDPAARFATCTELVDALRAALPHQALEYRRPREETESGAVPTFDAPAGPPRRRGPAVIAVLVLAVGMAAGGWVLTGRLRHPGVAVSIGRNVTIAPTTTASTTSTTTAPTTSPPAPPANPYGEVVGQPVTPPGSGSPASRYVLAVASRVFDATTIAAPGSPARYYAEWARLMGPPAGEAGPVVATDDGFTITAGEEVEITRFETDVAGLVTTFDECIGATCHALTDPSWGLLMRPPCEVGTAGCATVRSEHGRVTARKVMDVALRFPARSALYELSGEGTDAPAGGSAPGVTVTAITNPGDSVSFVSGGRYFLLRFADEPESGTTDVLTISFSDGTVEDMEITYP